MIKLEEVFFVANGLISIAIAYWAYQILVSGGLSIELSNGVAYLSGIVYGFLANKKLAFRDVSSLSRVINELYAVARFYINGKRRSQFCSASCN